MRNFKSLTRIGVAALEEEEILTAADPAEDGIVAAEVEQDIHAADQDAQFATSLEQRAWALEDLAETVEETVGPEASKSEIELTDIAQDMAGIDVDGLEVEGTFGAADKDSEGRPSLESMIGRKISTEGMRERVKSIWDAILRLVEKIWDKILEIWRKLFDGAKSVKKQARALNLAADAKHGASLKEGVKDIQLGNLASTMAVNGKSPKNKGDITAALSVAKNVGSDVLLKHSKKVIEAGDALKTAIGKVKIEKPSGDKPGTSFVDASAMLGEVNRAAQPVAESIHSLLKVGLTGDKRFESESFGFLRSEHLPTNKMLVGKTPKDKQQGGALGLAATIRGTQLELKVSDDNFKPKSEETKIQPLTPSEVISVAEDVSSVADVVAEFHSKYLRELEKRRNSLKDVTSSVAKSVSDDHEAQMVKVINSLAGYNTSYSQWCNQPFGAISALMLTTCRAAMACGHKSLSCYESK